MMLALFGSPHRSGVTDRLGWHLAAGLGVDEAVYLRDLCIASCRGCQECMRNGGDCVLPPDGADWLFARLQNAEHILVAAPIYFYALPGQLKIFMDRSQKYWGREGVSLHPRKKAHVLLVAGRPRGARLFAGALLSLKWFLKPFGFCIVHPVLLRGIDQTADIGPELESSLRRQGRTFRHELAAGIV